MQEEFDMTTYIKKSIAKQYVEFGAPLNPEEYNNLGETWQDYLDNKWVPLSNEQIAFHKANPNATVKEVWDMRITPTPPRTLEQAKQEKKAQFPNHRQDTSDGTRPGGPGNDIEERNGEGRVSPPSVREGGRTVSVPSVM
jgi:hypothetical protein